MSVREIEGNIKVEDSDIPKGYKKLKWKFESSLGEEMCDLTISTHSDAWYLSLIVLEIPFWDAPDILKVKVTNESGQTVAEKDYSGEKEPGTTQSHLELNPCIQPEEQFTVEIEFDMEFAPGDWIEFSPSAKGNVGLAYANPDSSFTGSPLLAGIIATSHTELSSITSQKEGILSLLDAGLPLSVERLRPIRGARVMGKLESSGRYLASSQVIFNERLSRIELALTKLQESLESKKT